MRSKQAHPLAESPVRQFRKAHNLSIGQLARGAGVTDQVVYYNECGCYKNISPSIKNVILVVGDIGEAEIDLAHITYISEKRSKFGSEFSTKLERLPTPNAFVHPFSQFRDYLGLSTIGFAKSICIHPNYLSRLERNTAKRLPVDIEEALLAVGMDAGLVEELDLRVQEYYLSNGPL